MGILDRFGRFLDDVVLLPDDLREQLEAAEDAFRRDQREQAEALFSDALAQRPGLVRAATGLAEVMEARADWRGARGAIAEARRSAPDQAELALWAARLALRCGDAEEARIAARDAAQTLVQTGGEAYAQACALRARAEWQLGRPDRAARELRKACAADPTNVELRIELVEAWSDAREPDKATDASRGIGTAETNAGNAARIGLALRRLDVPDAAAWLKGAADADVVPALLALAHEAVAHRDLDEAKRLARRAVRASGSADALASLGTILSTAGEQAEAAEAFAAASQVAGGSVDLMRRAVAIAPLGDREALARHVESLEALVPHDATARAGRAWLALLNGDLPLAEKLSVSSSDVRAILAAATVRARTGRVDEALALLDDTRLDDANASDGAVARDIRREALHVLLRSEDGTIDIAGAIDIVARFATTRDLEPTKRELHVLRDELDRPLFVAVMGEFNAGKSTFVNAFVGARVAPMGILPTTATLNVLRGGAERRVRLVRVDGTTREGDWEELSALLAEAASGKGHVSHVEIMLPSQTLERVWIADTPGTNSLSQAHASVAEEAARRADAVLWVFDARQAGKHSEEASLAPIERSGRRLVPVLNKADLLHPDDLERVRQSLIAAWPDLSPPFSVSSRLALDAQIEGDTEKLAASGYPQLLEHLETNLFSKSRELKRHACGLRLVAILDAALATESVATAQEDATLARLEHVAGQLAEARVLILPRVDTVVREFEEEQERAFNDAADEVVAFVRPRTHRFARHGADFEDRSFLAELIQRRVGDALSRCEKKLVDAIAETLSPVAHELELSEPGALEARIRAAVAPPFAGLAGYQRGLLLGGVLHRFFDQVLPHATLETSNIAEALSAARANVRGELRPSLLEAVDEMIGSIEKDRAAMASRAERVKDALLTKVFGPLRVLREVVSTLLGPGATAR